jgi:hypothetical protein
VTDFHALILGCFLDSLWQFSRWYREAIELQLKFNEVASMVLFPELYEDDTTYDDMP